MKVLITGGAGFLGQELCKLLLSPESTGLRRCEEAVGEAVAKVGREGDRALRHAWGL